MEKGRIYKIIFKPENKIIYIGSTTNYIENRFSEHLKSCYSGKNKNKLYKFMIQYNPKYFEVIQIEKIL